jgi:8-oxo-dGTP pyrophosphatase MutT (NUDIX family)
MFPEYLMVQRKDSLAYVEFIRGKYDLKNLTYLATLFTHMTGLEHYKILTSTFDDLWRDLWSPNGRQFMKEYNAAKHNFDILRRGYLIRGADARVVRVDAAHFINTVPYKLDETEWGFPKGRRNFFEDDKRCALREFREETGINLAQIRILRDLKPVEEIFSGTNRLRYKHVYYVAKFVSNDQDHEALFDPTNRHQAREIRDVRWFPYKEAQDKIKDCNVERKELLKRINSVIVKKSLQKP